MKKNNDIAKEIFIKSIGGIFYGGARNEHGQLVERTKQDYPYSYDGFVTYRGGENKEANLTVYSDRIHNAPEYDKACKKVFGDEGQMFFGRSPESIELFLREFYQEPKIKLILVMECCNVSSGYPLWRFDINCPQK